MPTADPTTVRPLLVFDGDCAFCTTWVNRLRDALPRFPEATPWQWADLDALGLSREDVTAYVWLLNGSRHSAGHLAFAGLLRMQPGFGYRFLGNLVASPVFSPVFALGYRFVARFRHRLPGGTPACALPRA